MTGTTVLIMDEDADWYCETLAKSCPGFQFLAAYSAEEAAVIGVDAEIFCGLAPFIPPELIKALPQLKWIQALTTGVDNLLKMECLPSSVVLTSCKGFHGPQMSELAILLMLSLARRFPAMLDNQKRAEWHRWPQPLLEGKTVCIVGLGGISEALAKRCLPFGMRITGVSDGRTQVDGVDRIYRRAEMKSAAADCDFLVVLVPYSEATHHLINADVLAAMKPAAHLINISRGGCVDEAAVINAVNSGVIASAGLDVFETEPLPVNDPIWSTKNIIVTPHIGGMSDNYHEQAMPFVRDNLNAYLEGGLAALNNIVPRLEK